MKSLDANMTYDLRDSLMWATAPEYLIQIEAAGNIVPYRAYLGECMMDVHNSLSADASIDVVMHYIDSLYYSAPWFN
jgi:hypothetical protein